MSKRSRSIWAFLAIAFGLAWAIWEIPFLIGLVAGSGAFQLIILIGAFAPALAAIIVRKFVERSGFADAGLAIEPDQWRYYVAAVVIPIAVVAFVVIAAPRFGLSPSTSSGALVRAPGLLAFSLIAAPILWGEEFGWRSYLQIRLFPERPLVAAIATGLIWGVWHYPLLIRMPELPLHPYATLILFPVGTVLYSIVFGWLRLRSASVWPSSLAHSAFNNFRSPIIGLLFAGMPDMLPIALLGLVALGMIAGAILLLHGFNARRA
jgi:membrane protease YdiL (CAAX protease family)